MAKCKYCGRSGLMLSVTREGLCKGCAPIVVMDVQQRVRIMKDSLELIEKSARLEIRLSK